MRVNHSLITEAFGRTPILAKNVHPTFSFQMAFTLRSVRAKDTPAGIRGDPLGHRLQGSGVGGGVLSPEDVRYILTYTTH